MKQAEFCLRTGQSPATFMSLTAVEREAFDALLNPQTEEEI